MLQRREALPAAYVPRPIETDGIDLGPELERLAERLAESNHDHWAERRLAEGWSYGPQRDDGRRRHPGLVPYRALPEAEKEYDRATAMGTLRSVVALGFRILPPDGASGAGEEISELRAWLASGLPDDAARLSAIWRAHDEGAWRSEPALYSLLASRFLALGDPLLAHEVLTEAERVLPGSDPGRRHLLGLALARAGALEEANAIAAALREEVGTEGVLLEEVLGLLGRTHKDLALAASSADDRRRRLESALEAYSEAFRRTGRSYSGVNAATLALLLDRPGAAELAARARDAALEEIASAPADYWLPATLGEAALVLGDEEEARRWYARAVEGAGREFGSIASMRRQAKLVATHRGMESGWIDRVLRVPTVVVFAGHMVDRPGRPEPRFPPAREEEVKEAIRARLAELGAGFGYAGAARGSDLLFLEAMAERGGETVVVLPYPAERFLATSVEVEPTGGWRERFERACERASEVVVASGGPSPAAGLGLDYGNLLALGLAIIRSQTLETGLVPLALWDGRDSREGTGAAVRRWRERGYDVGILPPPCGAADDRPA